MTETAKQARTLSGKIVSDKREKTITVLVERRVKHPVYGKIVSKSTKISAHDEGNQGREGDVVTISETRPISKSKSWQLVEIVERAAEV